MFNIHLAKSSILVKAMTVNMYRPMPGMPGIEPDTNDQDA